MDIMVDQLKLINDNYIIDIRSNKKYNDGHILNSQNIPFDNLINNPEKFLDYNFKYYIYCQKGNKSKILCQILNNKGYNLINILGGYEAWILNK